MEINITELDIHATDPSEEGMKKLADAYKSEKRAKNLQKRLAKWPGVWYYT